VAGLAGPESPVAGGLSTRGGSEPQAMPKARDHNRSFGTIEPAGAHFQRALVPVRKLEGVEPMSARLAGSAGPVAALTPRAA
jgi:hypothetical protein